MLSDSALLSSPPYSRVVKYHFFFAVFVCFWCFGYKPGWENVRYVERIGTHKRENAIRSKRNWTIFCPAGPQTPPTQAQSSQAKESWTGGPISWRRWECSQHFLENAVSSDRPQLERAGLPLTTGKLSGVWERWRLAQNWLQRHASPLALHSSWFSPDWESRRESFGA